MKCRVCHCWIAPEWVIKLVEIVVIALAIIMGAWLVSGCSSIHVETPDGYSASYTRIGSQDISGLRFEKGENGLYRLTLDKQSSDSDVLSLIRQLVTQ